MWFFRNHCFSTATALASTFPQTHEKYPTVAPLQLTAASNPPSPRDTLTKTTPAKQLPAKKRRSHLWRALSELSLWKKTCWDLWQAMTPTEASTLCANIKHEPSAQKNNRINSTTYPNEKGLCAPVGDGGVVGDFVGVGVGLSVFWAACPHFGGYRPLTYRRRDWPPSWARASPADAPLPSATPLAPPAQGSQSPHRHRLHLSSTRGTARKKTKDPLPLLVPTCNCSADSTESIHKEFTACLVGMCCLFLASYSNLSAVGNTWLTFVCIGPCAFDHH